MLVYTIQHDIYARVTQMHWDTNGLHIRQSRLLDLRGPEPTRDAYLLIRWMASQPVGSTAYKLLESDLQGPCNLDSCLWMIDSVEIRSDVLSSIC